MIPDEEHVPGAQLADVPDAHLVHLVLHGDAASFRLLFDRYYAMIHAYAYRSCLVEIEAEEIAQETFIRAARGICSYRGTASFKNWLYRIAHNALIDWKRKNSRERIREQEYSVALASQHHGEAPDFTEVHSALNQLSPELRETVALVYFEEMNHGEVAAVMGCAETTISWRIFRAKSALRKLLGSKKGAFS